jgi:hypothetical protein
MHHLLCALPHILSDGPEALTLVRRHATYRYEDPVLSVVFRTRQGTHLEAVFHPKNRRITLRAATAAADFALAFQWHHVIYLGSLEHAMDDALPFQTARSHLPSLAKWLEEDGAPARRLHAALDAAIGPRARARTEAMVALAKAVAIREGVDAGVLRPFLSIGPRFRIDQTVGGRSHPRLVGVFRARVKGAGAPPDLKAFAGTARLWRAAPHSLNGQPTLSDLSYIDVQVPADASRHERLAWRFRAIEAFAAEDYDITPWLLA